MTVHVYIMHWEPADHSEIFHLTCIMTLCDVHCVYMYMYIVYTCTCTCMYSCFASCLSIPVTYSLFSKGSIPPSDLECDYEEDVEFLVARLKLIEGEKDVCVLIVWPLNAIVSYCSSVVLSRGSTSTVGSSINNNYV